MDLHDCILKRRSIRNYTGEPVPAEKLSRVLEAIRWAPSWANTQPWEVIVVDDPQLKAALQRCVPDNNPGRKAVVQAPLLLVVCGTRGKSGHYDGAAATVHGDWVMFDLGIACQNACLAARAEGLGTLHLGLLDHRSAGEVLGLPAGVELYEIIPLGYPAKDGRAPARRELGQFVHRNRFGGGWA